MRIIALFGHKGNGKTFTAQFIAGALKKCYIISFYDVLDYIYPGYRQEEKQAILTRINGVRKNYVIDSLKVKLAFIEPFYDNVIIDDIDSPEYAAPLKNKLGAITVDIVKVFPKKLPLSASLILKEDRYCTTDYVIENPLLVSDLKANVLNFVKELNTIE